MLIRVFLDLYFITKYLNKDRIVEMSLSYFYILVSIFYFLFNVTTSLFLPFERRLFMTFLPPVVLILERKP